MSLPYKPFLLIGSLFIVLIMLTSSLLPIRGFVINSSKRVRIPDTLVRAKMSKASTTSSTRHPKVLVAIADGSEEIETVTTVDTLVRAGVQVTLASVMPNINVVCSRGVKITADRLISECVAEEWDMIVCPGGLPGAQHLSDSPDLTRLLQNQALHNKFIAAICAAPAVVLAHHNLIGNSAATCYPADKFTSRISNYSSAPVVVDGHIITSQGPGTSLPFALKLVETLCGPEKASAINKEMIGGRY